MSGLSGWYSASSQSIEAFLMDGTYQLLTRQTLDLMLDRKQVRQFKRASGWVIVGVDPIRVQRGGDSGGYSGRERRGNWDASPELML